MLNKLGTLLTAIVLAASMAEVNTAFAQEVAVADAGLQYRQGAFYYGSDCGGNSVPEPRAPLKTAAPGLILGGEAASHIVGYMNCDDRRQAFSVLRDGLEGRLGQPYGWHNSNGGGFGTMTPVRQFMRGPIPCRDFREETLVGSQLVPRNGTACRQGDGNWHTL